MISHNLPYVLPEGPWEGSNRRGSSLLDCVAVLTLIGLAAVRLLTRGLVWTLPCRFEAVKARVLRRARRDASRDAAAWQPHGQGRAESQTWLRSSDERAAVIHT